MRSSGPRRDQGGAPGARPSRRVDHVEGLGQPALGQAEACGGLRHPAGDERVELRHVADLRDVAAQGCELAVGHVRHVDGVVGARAGPQPDLRDGPRRQPLVLEQLREGEGVAGVGVDRPQRRLAHGHVVGVAGPDAIPPPLRRAGEDALRAHLPDHPADVPAQVEGQLQPAVGMAQESDVGHTDFRRGRPLLRPPQHRHLLARRLVEAAGIAVGDDAVGDLGAGRRPRRHRPRAAEVDVVGVGEDAEGALDVLGGTAGEGGGGGGGGGAGRAGGGGGGGASPPGGAWGPPAARPRSPVSWAGLTTRRPCSTRPPATTSDTTRYGSSPAHTTTPGMPLTSVNSVLSPGIVKPCAAIATRNRATLSAPGIGRRAALTCPPPSLVRTTPGERTATSASTSPPATAAKNCSVTSRWVRRSVSKRGRRAWTCSLARCANWRTATSERPRIPATSAAGSPNTSRSTNTARSTGESVSSPTSSAGDPSSPTSAASAGSGPGGALPTGAVTSGSGSHGPT